VIIPYFPVRDEILTNSLLPEISRLLLSQMVDGRKPERISVTISTEGAFEYSLEEPASATIEVPPITA
jgi:hypothetical protein